MNNLSVLLSAPALPDRTGQDITERVKNLRFSSAIPGGYADCSFQLDGDQRDLIPHLSTLTIVNGSTLVWQGQVEDVDLTSLATTSVTAFGFRRLLTETSLRRIWRSTDLGRWRTLQMPPGAAIDASFTRVAAASVGIGTFDIADLTKRGVKIAGTGVSGSGPTWAVGESDGAEIIAPSGITFTRMRATVTKVGGFGSLTLTPKWSPDGSTWTSGTAISATGSINETPANSPDRVRLLMHVIGVGAAVDSADYYETTAIRLFGTSLDEDTTTGFNGGTILRDLIAQVPGLVAGTIETGSDFAIDDIALWERDSALAALEAIVALYSRDWAVWEEGRFDWVTRQPDGNVRYAISLQDVTDARIDTTLDGMPRTVYVVYTDASTQIEEEASAASTALSNPYVLAGRNRHLVVRQGVMTAATAAALAQQLATKLGTIVPARGSVSMALTQMVESQDSKVPAVTILPGDIISLYDMPGTSGILTPERDSRRVFRIVAAEADVDANRVSFDVESPGASVDQLLAQLAAVTRSVTG